MKGYEIRCPNCKADQVDLMIALPVWVNLSQCTEGRTPQVMTKVLNRNSGDYQLTCLKCRITFYESKIDWAAKKPKKKGAKNAGTPVSGD